MNKAMLVICGLALALLASACSSAGEAARGKDRDTIIIAWYPNESGAELKGAREEFGKLVEQATGKTVEHKTTTDYIIAIESIANGNADLAYLGPQGYIEAHDKNENVRPLVVSSGASGTLEDAVYYSWLAVREEDADRYRDGDGFNLDLIEGKTFSFVSTSSTSEFKVPSAGIVSHFGRQERYKDLKAEDLLEGGKGRLFSEVLFGNSHQGSAVNLLTGKADVAAFCDTCVGNYVELADGTANRPGAVYAVREDAVEPFHALRGKRFVLISVTPVHNLPFVVNLEKISDHEVEALKTLLTSDETANNPKIFVPEDSEITGMLKKTKNERFVEVDDAWFDPIRELSR